MGRDIKRGLVRIVRGKRFRVAAPVLLLVIILLSIFVSDSGITSANARGDGLLFYGVSANSNPQRRTYSGNADSFSSAANTVAGTNPPLTSVIRASSTKQEMIAGYVTTAGVLQIMCYDGTTWTNEWTATVGGSGTTRRFDIAYESNSGDVMVLYSSNAPTTNELSYRTKLGSAGCGSANWSGGTTLDPVRTSGTVAWVKMAWDRRGSSNLITAIWADTNAALSAMQWSGTAWGNEPSSALDTTLECAGVAAGTSCTAGTPPSTEDFDVEYESLSGDVVVVWADKAGGISTNGAFYTTCTGGTSTCTWTTPGVGNPLTAAITGCANDATNLDIAANPNSDEMVFASIGDAGGATSSDMQIAYWGGSSWTTASNDIDATTAGPVAGTHLVTVGWAINGGTSRSIIAYDDNGTTNFGYYTGNGSTFAAQTDITLSPAYAAPQKWYDLQADPFNQSRLMFTASDTNSDLFAKRLVMDSSGNFSLTNSDGAALETNLAQTIVGDFSFAYWRATSTYTQTSYRWYANADNVQPGTAWANQNTAYSSGTNASIFRLRMGITIGTADMDASSQAFKLQYSASTGGPWTDVDSNQNTWCAATTGVTCNTAWTARRKITINNSASSTNLTNYPLLIKLSSARVDYAKTQNSGQDIRFVDPSDPNTVLPFQIEKWDESGNSYVWVKVPQIDASSSTDYIWMYYGNASASDGQSATNVWDSNFRGVYHSAETSGTNVGDSTSNAFTGSKTSATSPNPTTSGQISGAQTYDGISNTGSVVQIADNNLLDLTTFTVSAWINPTNLGNWRTPVCKDNSGSPNYCLQTDPSNHVDMNYQSGASLIEAVGGTTLSNNTWYHITGTYDGTNLRVYVNGTIDASPVAGGTPSVNGNPVWIGRSSSTTEYFGGILDEARISVGARSADWIKADYLSQTDAMLTYSGEQDQSIDYSAGKWKFGFNPTPASGTIISTLLLGGATTKQSYQEVNPTVSNPTATPIGGIAEWDFSLDPGSICGGTYYFRMVKDDGTAFTTYSVYPQITLNIPSIVPTDQVMRGGKWFNNGVKQPYGCEWVSSH